MKKLAVITFAAMSAGSAFAADLPSAPSYAPAPVFVAYNWTGIYVGGHVGGATGRVSATDVTQPLGGFFTDLVPAGTEGFKLKKNDIAGGVHGGAQYQWQQIVFGVEGSWTGTDLKKRIISPYFPESDTQTGRIKNLTTVVGRLGYAFDRLMIYAKGGYAGADVNFKARDNDALVTFQQKGWHNGYAVGGGAEYAVTDSIILGFDYTHVDLRSRTRTGPNVFDDGRFGSAVETYKTKARVDTYLARLSYKY